jgi:hypothetical protein
MKNIRPHLPNGARRSLLRQHYQDFQKKHFFPAKKAVNTALLPS